LRADTTITGSKAQAGLIIYKPAIAVYAPVLISAAVAAVPVDISVVVTVDTQAGTLALQGSSLISHGGPAALAELGLQAAWAGSMAGQSAALRPAACKSRK